MTTEQEPQDLLRGEPQDPAPAPAADPSLEGAPIEGAPASAAEPTLADIASKVDTLAGELEASKTRERELELENARLQGRLEGGAAAVEPKFRFETSKEYNLYAENLGTKAAIAKSRADQGDEDAKMELENLKREWQATDHEYRVFNERVQKREEESRKREEERISFLAKRTIDPRGDVGKSVSLLHENGVALDRIEAIMLEPARKTSDAARERSEDAVRDAGVRRMSSATAIEEGRSRTTVPGPVGEEEETPDQAASNDFVRRYEEHLQPIDEQLFGE